MNEGCWRVVGTTRTEARAEEIRRGDIESLVWPGPDLSRTINESSHILVSVPPENSGDLFARTYHRLLADRAQQFEWVGYLSTTAVYGNRDGGWVDETSSLEPSTPRGKFRKLAERDWLTLSSQYGLPVHVFRLAGIYGPGRGPLELLASGRKKRIIKAGQFFNRIHVEDISRILRASMENPSIGAIYNVCDDLPAPPEDVTSFGASLLGLPTPEAVPFEEAEMSPMARSFYSESKRVCNRRVKDELSLELRYPDYKAGFESLAGQLRQKSRGQES